MFLHKFGLLCSSGLIKADDFFFRERLMGVLQCHAAFFAKQLGSMAVVNLMCISAVLPVLLLVVL